MTLSEIENTLEGLSRRHPNLNKELLTTILTAAGWESSFVQEAGILFEQHKNTLPKGEVSSGVISTQAISEVSSSSLGHNENTSVQGIDKTPSSLKVIETLHHHGGQIVQAALDKEEAVDKMLSAISPAVPVASSENLSKSEDAMVFYKQDGEEEGQLKSFEELPQTPSTRIPITPLANKDKESFEISFITNEEEKIGETKREKEEKKEQQIKELMELVPLTRLMSQQEPESLIIPKEQSFPTSRKVAPAEIPEDLPLLPFESSPHVWSFSRYKNVFHGEQKQEREVPVSQPPMVSPPTFVSNPIVVTQAPRPVLDGKKVKHEEDEEVSLEKVPLTRGDESLVFLAGTMLLVIILILGYMYSNGRL